MLMPYVAPDAWPTMVASWGSLEGLVLFSDLPLFPDKYKKLVMVQTLVLSAFFFNYLTKKLSHDTRTYKLRTNYVSTYVYLLSSLTLFRISPSTLFLSLSLPFSYFFFYLVSIF